MDTYEKKYNEALERARKAYYAIPPESRGARKIIEDAFPELRESDDEKIRKDIINLIYWLKGNPSLCSQYYNDRYDSMLAYLEKQKKKGENITANLLEDGITGIQRELIEFLANNIDTSWVDVIKSADAYTQRIRSMVEKQKEQKPEERFKEARKKYQVEWSEEEKQKLNRIYKILGYAADDKGFLESKRIIGDKEAIELQDFLISLRSRPKSSDNWKPSEDEERLINTSISFLKDFADKGYENAVECIDWLKSKLNGNSGK